VNESSPFLLLVLPTTLIFVQIYLKSQWNNADTGLGYSLQPVCSILRGQIRGLTDGAKTAR
jgi:hypothetical protein